MEKQNLFTEEELAKVTDETERKHLIECAQDQSKIDMKYMEIMSKYDLWEKGKRSRYFHATTHENAEKIMQDGVIRKGMDGGVYICKQPLEAARFVAIRGHETGTIFEVELEERKIVEAHDHNEAFFGYEVLDAREFGLPQARERVFTISCLKGEKFNFDDLIRTPMQDIRDFLEDNDSVPEVYDVTQPSVRNVIGQTGIKRAIVIKDYAFTITTRQDRTPAQVIDCGGGRFRYLTELECWRLQGYTDEDFERAKAVHKRAGRYYTALYKQAGNSIAVPIFESIFRKIILNETA